MLIMKKSLRTSKVFFSLNLKVFAYSHLSNKRGGWNKRGGGAKVAKSVKVEVGTKVEGEKNLRNK